MALAQNLCTVRCDWQKAVQCLTPTTIRQSKINWSRWFAISNLPTLYRLSFMFPGEECKQ
jgi:hypothetical protein